jgi:putative oxidoreductase
MAKTSHMGDYRLRRSEDYDITDALKFQKNDIGRFILRLSIGGLMLFHGIDKILHGTEQVSRILSSVGLPAFFSFGVFLGEVLAPVMLILGYKVRAAGFFVALDMFMAILLVHASDIADVSPTGGWMIELNVLYLLGAISIIFLGSGRIAISKGKGVLD